MPLSIEELAAVASVHDLMRAVNSVLIGKEDITKLTITAMLAGGHVLFEDIPGVGKTLLVRTIAASMGADFSRTQFTPDLVPSDIIGYSMPSPESGSFTFQKGPLFASIVLADELNRSSPRTQSAMLEAMAEKQVTIDGVPYSLPKPFFVLATQNPVEYEGTYPLPEAQLDRFFMQLSLGYPTPEQEEMMLTMPDSFETVRNMQPILSVPTFIGLQKVVPTIHVDQKIIRYIVALGNASRNHPRVRLGISPRGNQYLLLAAKAYAVLDGRSFVIPDDVQSVFAAVARHRLLVYDATHSGEVEQVIRELMQQTPPPLRS